MTTIPNEAEKGMVNGDSHHGSGPDVTTDHLIVGTGPAGGALASFLAQQGLTGIIVSGATSNAETPRAHITNMAALDCLRDIGVDVESYKLGSDSKCMAHTRWCNSMAGEEYCRIYSWGNDPKRKGDYELASPSTPLDLPQTLLEPLLTRYAGLNGFKVRWDTKFLSFVQHPNGEGVTTTLLDKLTNQKYRVHSKYLFAADGGQSQIVRQLDLPMIKRPGQGFAVNILIEADMSHLMENRMGNLHWILTPDKQHPDYAWIACMRMVKPWHQWMCIVVPVPGEERVVRPAAEYIKRIREFIGDDSIDIKVIDISTWLIHETVAEKYSEGNVFCLGDAVHRHPPNHGLGSNTCIQDAHNLAWKVGYVHKGIAGKELLDTYSIERQPVGIQVVTESNASMRTHFGVMAALGNLQPTVSERVAAFNELRSDSGEGRTRRESLKAGLEALHTEEHGLGIEMNQRYASSAVWHKDVGELPTFHTNPKQYYHPTTYPGARLPHVWLNTAIPGKRVSTIDLAGKGKFLLLTGIGGEGWKTAAQQIGQDLHVPLSAYSVGFRQDYEDMYLDWARIREVEESGCVLVRPDYFVSWRAKRWEGSSSAEKLREVITSVLGKD